MGAAAELTRGLRPGSGMSCAFQPILRLFCTVGVFATMCGPVLDGRAGNFDGQAKVMAFDLDRFIGDCCAALSADPPQKAVRELVARAVSMPTAVLGGLGEPRRAEVQKPHQSDRLTILNVI